MALSVTASLTGATSPQKVSVVVAGMTAGDSYEVTGVWSGGSWPVRGGSGVSDGSQLVLVDVSSPINVPVTYQVVTDSGSASSTALTVTAGSRHVLSSLTGDVATTVTRAANGLPRSFEGRAQLLSVAGRRAPVARWNVRSLPAGEWQLVATLEESKVLDDLLATGAPLVFRSDGAAPGVPAVDTVLVTGVSSQQLGLAHRVWTLAYQVTGDPEPGTVVPLSTGADFDATYAGLTGADFDAEWAGLSGDLFDATDWTTH